MKSLMLEKNHGIFSVITNYQDSAGNYKKELLFFHDSEIAHSFDTKWENMIFTLSESEEWNFLDETEHCSQEEQKDGMSLLTWKIGNTKNTRKNLETFLKGFYKYGAENIEECLIDFDKEI